MIFLFWVLARTIPDKIAFSDSSVIAARSRVWTALCSSPFVSMVSFSVILSSNSGLKNRQPIFGNKKFKPRMFEPVLKVYPLFSKEFRENMDKEKKEKIKKYSLVFLCFLVLFVIIVPFGFCPRDTLDDNNVLKAYNSFNKETHSINMDDTEKLIINVEKEHKKWSFYIELYFVTEDYTYSLNENSFKNLSLEETLKYMLKIKNSFKDGRCEVSDEKYVDRLIFFGNYSPTEEALIRSLFS